MRSFPIVASICLYATGCGPTTPAEQHNDTQPAAITANTSIEQDVANIQAGVVRTSDAQRLDELERRIGRLETTPDKLDLELLSSRVQALEAKVGVDGLAAAVPVVVPAAASSPTPGAAKSPTPGAVRKPAPRPQSSPTNTAGGSADR